MSEQAKKTCSDGKIWVKLSAKKETCVRQKNNVDYKLI